MDRSSATDAASVDELDIDGLDPAVGSAVASVFLALYYYYIRGQRDRGIFIGLWPATILGIAIIFRLEGLKRRLADLDD